MSATLDLEKFKKYFNSEAVVKVEGRTHQIQVFNTMEPQVDYIVSCFSSGFYLGGNAQMYTTNLIVWRSRRCTRVSTWIRRNWRVSQSSYWTINVFKTQSSDLSTLRQSATPRTIKSFPKHWKWQTQDNSFNQHSRNLCHNLRCSVCHWLWSCETTSIQEYNWNRLISCY